MKVCNGSDSNRPRSVSEIAAECIDDYLETAQACKWCADECIGNEGMEECASLSRNVADLTTLHARFMVRDSKYSSQLAETCADACEESAAECAHHDTEHCQGCADMFQQCAESCRQMANA